MGLNREQKKLVRAWVAAGLKDAEIIRLAKEQVPPFHISQPNISKNYRKPTERRVQELMQQERTDEVLRTGLAVKENRIKRLTEYEELLQGKLQHERDARAMSALVNQARGCLDDIAKELGERREKIDMEANVQSRDIVKIMQRVFADD